MKKNIGKILIVLLTIIIVIAYTISKYNNDEDNKLDYKNSIYIMTENDNHDGNDYYEINKDGKLRITDNFIPDKDEKYYFKDCFISNIDIDSGKILNTYKEDTCIITDSFDNKITLDDTLKDMINKTTRYVNQIMDITIYKVNNHYYETIHFRLSTHESYKFYYYDIDNKKLKHIYTFNDKYVTHIKEKDKLIFEGE